MVAVVANYPYCVSAMLGLPSLQDYNGNTKRPRGKSQVLSSPKAHHQGLP